MNVAGRLALALTLVGVVTATARAQTAPPSAESAATDAGTPTDAPTPVVPVVPVVPLSPIEPQAPAPPPLAPPEAPAPEPRAAQAVDPAPVSSPRFGAGFDPPSTDVWPLEYVLRPQTLPAGTWRGALNASLSLPDPTYRSPASGRAFRKSLGLGVGVTMGVTDRIEAWFSLPRIICIGGDPSGCSSFNRINGTGFGFGWGAVRTRAFQLELSADLAIALSSPTVPAAAFDASTKWLLGTSVALVFNAWISKWLGAPAYYSSQAVGSGGASGSLDLQVTRHLLAFATASPTGPLDHLDDPRVAASGGLSWTFDNGLELAGSGVLYNVLARRPAWVQTVPGGAVGLVLRGWL
jgi:hypothetical protein